MKIKSVELHNFCQHKDLKLTFSFGLNGILGANGTGKTNILTAIQYALTGSTTDPVENYIRIGMDPKDTSYVSVVLQSDITGHEVAIKRSIKPRSVLLSTRMQKLDKARDVAEFMEKNFGLDVDVLQKIQIVPQENIVSFFRLQPSLRAAILQHIYGIDALQTRRDALRSCISSIRPIEDARQKKALYEDMIKQKELSIEPYKDIPEDAEIVVLNKENTAKKMAADAVVSVAQHYAYVNQQRARAKADLQAKELELARVLTECVNTLSMEDLSSKEDSLLTKKDELNSLLQKNKATLNDFERFVKTLADIDVALMLMSDCDFNAISDVKKLAEELSQVRSWKARIEPAVETGSCPLCGHEYPHAKEEMKNILAEEDALNVRYIQAESGAYTLSQLIQRVDKAVSTLTSVDFVELEHVWSEIHLKPTRDTQTALLSITRKILSKVAQDRINIQVSYDQQFKDYAGINLELEELRRNRNTIMEQSQRKAAAQAAVDSAQKYYDQSLITELPPEPDAEAVKQATVESRECQEIADKYITWFQYASLRFNAKKEIAQLKNSIEALDERVLRDDELTAYKSDLQSVLDLLNPDNLPRAVVLGMSKAVVDNVNAYLTLFNAPFTVTMDANTDFQCTFQDGVTQVAARLSGGQKVVLALAWRLALHSTFSVDEACGFMTLDEPTTFLDKDNIENLTSVIQQIRDLAAQRNIQILIITHEESLAPLFDTVIQL